MAGHEVIGDLDMAHERTYELIIHIVIEDDKHRIGLLDLVLGFSVGIRVN